MCGFVAIAERGQPVDEQLLCSLTERLRHRGPDQGSVYLDQGRDICVGLGSRRLRIIDVSAAGDQPMSDETGDIWIAYNGELYNHSELRSELEARGYRYRSRTDTETIIHAYEEYGPGCLSRFNGMFAFALYDRRKGLVLLARDRMGIKPLYYWWDGQRLAAASELKALLACPWIPRKVNPDALDCYLAVCYVPSPLSMIEGVQKLRPGTYLALQDGHLSAHAYWTLSYTGNGHTPGSTHDLVARTREVVESAVRRQLMSDVPLGALLSGGIDSTIVTGLISQHHGSTLDTFAVGYDLTTAEDLPDVNNDDLHYARMVSERLGTRHHEIVVGDGPDLLDRIAATVHQLDEPLAEATAISQQAISRIARDSGVLVLLTGDGSDELFGGYPWYPWASRVARYQRVPALRRLLPLLSRLTPGTKLSDRINHLSDNLKRQDVDKFCAFYSLGLQRRRRFLADGLLSPGRPDPFNALLVPIWQQFAAPLPDRWAWADLNLWIREYFNQRLDRSSMSAGVEARVPFQDNEVVDFALTVPMRYKLHKGQSKYLLREAFRDIIPAEVLARPKLPYVGPIAAWLRGALRDFTLEVLVAARIERFGLLDPSPVRRAAEEYCLSGIGDPLTIWKLLILQLWCEAYLGGHILHSQHEQWSI